MEAIKEFGDSIDSAYNLKGICENATFVNPKGELGAGLRKSPLSDKLLLKMNTAWQQVAKLNLKWLQQKEILKEIRQQQCICLLEEQFQLMCTLTHLFLAFSIAIEVYGSSP